MINLHSQKCSTNKQKPEILLYSLTKFLYNFLPQQMSICAGKIINILSFFSSLLLFDIYRSRSRSRSRDREYRTRSRSYSRSPPPKRSNKSPRRSKSPRYNDSRVSKSPRRDSRSKSPRSKSMSPRSKSRSQSRDDSRSRNGDD